MTLQTGILSPAERGALALAEAAAALDHATDPTAFLKALERNHRVWQTVKTLADHHQWRTPNREQARYALSTVSKMGKGVNDDHLHALISINRHVSAQLAGSGDIGAIRRRAHAIWEARGRPQGEDLDHWLLAELEISHSA